MAIANFGPSPGTFFRAGIQGPGGPTLFAGQGARIGPADFGDAIGITGTAESDLQDPGKAGGDDVIVASPNPPAIGAQLSITRAAADDLTLSWTGEGTLEQTYNLAVPNWQAAPSRANPQTVSASVGSARFYRVVKH